MSLHEISPYELNRNLFNTIGGEWLLVTAGDKEKFNTMTVSWGGMGVLWNKLVAYIFIRPQRFTYEFHEENEYFTITAYNSEYRNALKYCGTHSGRDVDKTKVTGLTPVFTDRAPYFEQARLVFVCRKIYYQDLDKNNMLDKKIFDYYKNEDYHRMYVSEIVKVLVND